MPCNTHACFQMFCLQRRPSHPALNHTEVTLLFPDSQDVPAQVNGHIAPNFSPLADGDSGLGFARDRWGVRAAPGFGGCFPCNC